MKIYLLDIGHFRVAGVDAYQVIEEMGPELMGKLDYVHLHRKGEARPGMSICDHWPLEEGYPEVGILKKLMEARPGAKVILEVDGKEDLRKSLEVLGRENLFLTI